MKAISTFFLLFLIHCISFSQKNSKNDDLVGFACYESGHSTEVVLKLTMDLRKNDHKRVASLLSSANPGEVFLAVVVIQRLVKLGQYQLNEKEQELIALARSSKKLVKVCSGCTYFDEVPLKELLSGEDRIGTRFWLDEVVGNR